MWDAPADPIVSQEVAPSVPEMSRNHPIKRFTPDEANRMLPQLTKDLERARELVREARAKVREKEMIKAVGYRDDGTLIMYADYQEAQTRLEEAVRKLNAIIEGIHREGVRIKDLERGLVDFPAIIHGQDVLLCWELGESAVLHFHDLESGYRGRKPIPKDWRL